MAGRKPQPSRLRKIFIAAAAALGVAAGAGTMEAVDSFSGDARANKGGYVPQASEFGPAFVFPELEAPLSPAEIEQFENDLIQWAENGGDDIPGYADGEDLSPAPDYESLFAPKKINTPPNSGP